MIRSLPSKRHINWAHCYNCEFCWYTWYLDWDRFHICRSHWSGCIYIWFINSIHSAFFIYHQNIHDSAVVSSRAFHSGINVHNILVYTSFNYIFNLLFSFNPSFSRLLHYRICTKYMKFKLTFFVRTIVFCISYCICVILWVNNKSLGHSWIEFHFNSKFSIAIQCM